MRIIQRGTIKGRRVTCAECKAILEYTEEDVFYVLDGPLKRDLEYIQCPECKRKIRVHFTTF